MVVSKTKYFFYGFVLAAVLIPALFYAWFLAPGHFAYIYKSSPGFNTEEGAKRFFESVPTCNGVSIRVRPLIVIPDSPGQSVCIGNLVLKQ